MLLTYAGKPIIEANNYIFLPFSMSTSALVFSCKFAAHFQNPFLKDHLWRAASRLHLAVYPWLLHFDQHTLSWNDQRVTSIRPHKEIVKPGYITLFI